MCWGVGRGRGDVGRVMRERCRKVYWGVGLIRGDVGKGAMKEEMWESVLGPHTLTHFPTPPPFLSPHPFPTCLHTSSPHTLSHTPPHSPHILSYSSPLPSHLSLPPRTPQHISLHLPPHLFPQLS